MKTRLIFVRHAEATGNVNRVFNGWTDGLLTEKGHKQAQKVADRLSDTPIDVIYSSSLTRTLQTASYISDKKGLPINKKDGLKEINGGDWEGKLWEELASIWPHENDTWENRPHEHQMPNGESMAGFEKRLHESVDEIVHENEGKNILIVTHGTAIRAMMCKFYGLGLEAMIDIQWYDNTSVTIVDYENGKYTVVLEGDNSHLGSELGTVENQDWWEDYKKTFEERRRKRMEAKK
ncbi:MAG TPA: histidine phosphatase family protein [Clostridia bacterium]